MRKDFEITFWSNSAESPSSTHVGVNVKEEAAPGINKSSPYDFMLNERFEVMSDDFKNAVERVLRDAGLL